MVLYAMVKICIVVESLIKAGRTWKSLLETDECGGILRNMVRTVLWGRRRWGFLDYLRLGRCSRGGYFVESLEG